MEIKIEYLYLIPTTMYLTELDTALHCSTVGLVIINYLSTGSRLEYSKKVYFGSDQKGEVVLA